MCGPCLSSEIEPKKERKIGGKNIEAEAKVNVDRKRNTFTEKLRIILASAPCVVRRGDGDKKELQAENVNRYFVSGTQWNT